MKAITLHKKQVRLAAPTIGECIVVHKYIRYHGFITSNEKFENKLFMWKSGVVHLFGLRFTTGFGI